jgi:hypothetical protein
MKVIYSKLSGVVPDSKDGDLSRIDIDHKFNLFANLLSRMVKGQELFIETEVIA